MKHTQRKHLDRMDNIMNNMKEQHATVCEHVIANVRPIKMIVHNHDKTWECMCGEIDHLDFLDAKVVKLSNLIKLDETILPIKQLPAGCVAERKRVDSKWEYSLIDD